MEERKRWLYSAEANNKLDQIDADWEERHSRPAEPIGFGPEYYRQRIEDANEKPFDVEKMRENMRMADARRARNDLRFGMFLVTFGIAFFTISTVMILFHIYPFNQ